MSYYPLKDSSENNLLSEFPNSQIGPGACFQNHQSK